MTVSDELRHFIVNDLNSPISEADLTDDYPLIEGHVIDSVGIFEIVSFIEEKFAVQIDDEELVSEHFGTIADIAKLVGSKQSVAG